MVFVRSELLRRALTDLVATQQRLHSNGPGFHWRNFRSAKIFPSRGRGSEWRLVQAGRLIEKKGLSVSLNAFAVFLDRYPNATLTIAGEGPLLDELQKLTRELNIEERVSFTGFVSQEQLREIYYRSHIFLPSQIGRDGNQEGVPNSMLEAMASGLPVFATEHGGIPEAIENAVSGVLVPEHDHETLSRALLSATQDLIFLSRIARSGAEVVRKNFDLRTQAQRLDDIYLEIIGGIVDANPRAILRECLPRRGPRRQAWTEGDEIRCQGLNLRRTKAVWNRSRLRRSKPIPNGWNRNWNGSSPLAGLCTVMLFVGFVAPIVLMDSAQ